MAATKLSSPTRSGLTDFAGRPPGQSDYDARLRVIEQDPNHIRQMVSGFVNSRRSAG